ncbi:MAG: PH domain-containing protein [Muribaculaceae bacterium]|nr:PH domain-containing protein [Muribaculaceae bacterium]
MEAITECVKPVDDLDYIPVGRRYRSVQMVLTASLYAMFAMLALFLLLLDDKIWFVIGEGIILVAFSVNMIIVRKAWMFKGYALRENDISYRSGIVFPTVTTMPYSRLQQVSVKQNPVARIFKLYSVVVVNGAQAIYSMSIPGLTKERAEQIKSMMIERMGYDRD